MKCFIATQAGDLHAQAVDFVLRSNGHETTMWRSADIPQTTSASIHLTPAGAGVSAVSSSGSRFLQDRYDTVWFRRRGKANLPLDLHPDDQDVAAREFSFMLDGLWSCLSPQAFWVNPWQSFHGSNNKTLQLLFARDVGFDVPETLISNCPGDIRAFYQEHRSQGIIFKPFLGGVWAGQGSQTIKSATIRLSEDDLCDDYPLVSAPGIYQVDIKKAYELRITMFGRHGVAVRIDSQAHEASSVDWRLGGRDLGLQSFPLDRAIQDRCFHLMERLGIVFGCFDLIVQDDGTISFLEVNEMGQFLWIEEWCPEIPMLNTFAEFLVSGTAEFEPQGLENPFGWVDLMKSGRLECLALAS